MQDLEHKRIAVVYWNAVNKYDKMSKSHLGFFFGPETFDNYF